MKTEQSARNGMDAVRLTAVAGLILGLSAGQAAFAGQTKPGAKPAATAKATSPVDKVIDMQKSGLSEDLIVRSITRENLTQELTSDDMIKLKKAGVSDKVISAMEPGSPAAAPAAAAPAAAPAAAAAAAPAPAAAAPVSNPAPSNSNLRRAAIDEFQWASVGTVVQQVFGTNVDIGKGIRALLTTRVQQAGKVRVVERAKVDTVMREQDFGASNRVKKGTNARVGQILGADVYLMGDIVAFGRDDRKKGVALGTLGFRGPIGGLRIGGSEDKAIIVINYRIVDAETSEVIDSGEARGESSRKSKGIGGFFGTSGRVAGGGVDMTSSNFAETIIGEATMDACNKLADILAERASNLPTRQVDIEARVADITGANMTIAAGSNDGVQAGDRFDVFKILNEIRDPVTKEVLDLNVEKTGTLVIATVRERIAVGQYAGAPVTTANGLVRKQQ